MRHANRFYGRPCPEPRTAAWTGAPTPHERISTASAGKLHRRRTGAPARRTPAAAPICLLVRTQSRRCSWWLGRREHRRRRRALDLPGHDGSGTEPEADRTGTISYPFHGWEGRSVYGDAPSSDRDDLIRWSTEAVQRYACTPDEYRTPVRKLYERADSSGRSRLPGRLVAAYRHAVPLFSRWPELRTHRRVTSGPASAVRSSTVPMPAATWPCTAMPMVLENEDMTFGRIGAEDAPAVAGHARHADRACHCRRGHARRAGRECSARLPSCRRMPRLGQSERESGEAEESGRGRGVTVERNR